MSVPPDHTDDPRERNAILLEEGLDRGLAIRMGGRLLRIPWMTTFLMVLILVVHLAIGYLIWSRGNTAWWGILLEDRGDRTQLLTRCGAMSAVRLDSGEIWRLASAAFLHANAMHLLFNGLALLVLGRLCEAIYGPSRLLFLFLCSSMVGAQFSWMGGNELSVGASGGIFGFMGAAIVFGWRFRSHLPPDIAGFFGRRLLPWLFLNLGLGVLIPSVDNWGHLGGLLGGVLLGSTLGNRTVPGFEGTVGSRFLMVGLGCGLLLWGLVGVFGAW